MSHDTLILLGVAGLLMVAVYIRHRELALGLVGALVALILYQRKPASLPSPPPAPRIEPERTAEKVQHEVEQDRRSPEQLELDLEREFGLHRPRDKL